MCFIIALRIMMRMGGHLYIQIHPLHASVKIKNRLLHGKICKGVWSIETKSWKRYEGWTTRRQSKLIRIF